MDRLGAARRGEMLALLERHFAGIRRSCFERDLEAKNWVLMLRRDAGQGREGGLVGFTSLLYERVEVGGETLGVVSSGDTIVDPAAWGSSALSRSWIEAVRWVHAAAGPVPGAAAAATRPAPLPRLFWLLLTSGFRTYRMLPLYWREFYPRHDLDTPEPMRRLLEHLARCRYGSFFDPRSGRVRFPEPQVLRPHLEGIPERRRRDPHIAFFERANPAHAAGDELVCLTEIASGNLTRAGRRMVRAGSERGLMVEGAAGPPAR